MRQHILATAFAAAVTALAYGQNLNPTVEVTNAYEGGASSINKPAQKMAVPDTVTRFNLDFDYSVFEKPYRGAYEFSPYYVELKPAPKVSTTGKFYLRAGAGFTLHPELDMVWSPVRKERFRLNVYATHHSYFGRYHRFLLTDPVEHVSSFNKSGDKMKGYLADTKAGIDGTFGWEGGEATLDIGYKHRMAKIAYHDQKMGGVEAKGRVRSLPSDEPHFLYDAAFEYHFLGSGLVHTIPMFSFTREVAESGFRFDGTFGPVLDADRRILVDLDVDLARYMRDKNGYTGLLSATPKYQFNLDRWRMSLGVKVAAIIYSDDFDLFEEQYRHKSGTVFPDVHVDFHLVDDRLILQTSATGGDKFNSFSSRFLSRPFTYEGGFGHSMERVRAMVGARGNIASRFRYDLQAGYARWAHAPIDGYRVVTPVPATGAPAFDVDGLLPAQYDRAFNLLFAELDYGWKSESVTVDGRFAYRWTNLNRASGTDPAKAAAAMYSFAPAAFTGYIRPAYNWGERFKAGMNLEWSTARKNVTSVTLPGQDPYDLVTRIPGWVDLGLFAEYRFTHRLGFWAKGGNLLNQTVQRIPLVAEAGMYFTAGAVLNF